jgi:glycosyltransferase involved in cell wall biosynthesis
MRIGIDAGSLCHNPTGVGHYLGGLIRQWAAMPSAPFEFVLYAPDDIPLPLDARRFAIRIVRGTPGTWWQQVRLPRAVRADHLDVFFSPAYTAPLVIAAPTVVAIHDVSFAAHPEWFRTREGLRLRSLSRRSAAQARRIITISEFSRTEIAQHLDVAGDRIRVVPPGVPVRHAIPVGVKAPRVLFVGSLFNRRHVVDLVRAFAILARARPDASLDIAGENRTHPHEDVAAAIRREGLDSHVRWHRYASDEQLRDLYSRARAFAFLSEYEGLGLTPLEAVAAGVPPVLLDTPVARESCADAAIYVARPEPKEVAAALEQVLFDDPTRDRLLAAAPSVLARYSWPRAATQTLQVLEEAAQLSIG